MPDKMRECGERGEADTVSLKLRDHSAEPSGSLQKTTGNILSYEPKSGMLQWQHKGALL